jgi:hypothetical protein
MFPRASRKELLMRLGLSALSRCTNFVAVLLACATPVRAEFYAHSYSFGSAGTGDGQFTFSLGLAFDPQGNVYVVDGQNGRNGGRVEKFTHSGQFLMNIGSRGTANGQFFDPAAIAIDPASNLYVTDFMELGPVQVTGRIQKFDANGNFLTTLTDPTLGSGQRAGYSALATDSSGNVFVAEGFFNSAAQTERLLKFNSSGQLLAIRNITPGEVFLGLATDTLGNVYVSEFQNNRIDKFDNNLNFLSAFGNRGVGPGDLLQPTGLAVDSSGRIFESDSGSNRLKVFSNGGKFITLIDPRDFASGRFSAFGGGIAVDPQGNVFSSDVQSVNVFAPLTFAVPEPSSLTLLGIGTISLLGYGWRRRKRATA